MIRFMDINREKLHHDKQRGGIIFNSDIWSNCRKYFSEHKTIEKVPIFNGNNELICYAYQDGAANREMRMLYELESANNLICFKEVYTEYMGVVIYECNELAYYFAQYLKNQNIPVRVMGNYWKAAGWVDNEVQFVGKSLQIYAEGTWEHTLDLQYELQRTVGVEFECIDRIYMANIKNGLICDSVYDLPQFIEKLKCKQVVLLGVDDVQQDVYDVLTGYGVDICAFFREDYRKDLKLLGKPIIGSEELAKYQNPALIDCWGRHGALGNQALDNFVYHGFVRNQNYFFIKDYIDIPRTNLLHIIQNRSVYLCGDKYLCSKLGEYLKEYALIEEIKAEDIKTDYKKKILGLIVIPQIINADEDGDKWSIQKAKCRDILQKKGITDYSEYFCKDSSFILIEDKMEKYTINNLVPRGIIIGAIDGFSGNVFFRDCLDNHPQILQMGFTFFECNMFIYCVRLSCVDSNQIFPLFWEMLEQDEPKYVVGEFSNRHIFQQVCEKTLKKKRKFTSQELFVLFAIAYSEMKGRKIENISDKYIYFEPHNHSVALTTRYSKWFSNSKINGFTVRLNRHRVNVTGSAFSYWNKMQILPKMKNILSSILGSPHYEIEVCNNWEIVEMKFEDIKLYPKREWNAFCHKLNIVWSNTLLSTTRFGEESVFYNGVTGYDLAPVYKTYNEYLSFCDKMRIEISAKNYLVKANYSVSSVLDLSFKEVQELFLKQYKIENRLEFDNEEDKKEYMIDRAKIIRAVLAVNVYNNILEDEVMYYKGD